MQRPFSQQQNASNSTSQKKERPAMTQNAQPDAQAISSYNEPKKQTQQSGPLMDNLSHDNTTSEILEESKLFRSAGQDRIKEKSQLIENRPKLLSGQSDQSDKKPPVLPATSKHNSASNPNSPDSNHVVFLRHSKASSNSFPAQKKLQVPHRSQQSASQQQILRDSSPHENTRLRAQTIRVRSYPTERQHTFTALHATLQKHGNLGQPWSIPRVSTSGRPHSLTLPSNTRYQDGAHTEFSNYNPSASPRALRSHSRTDSDNIQRQASPSNPTSPSPSATNPRKSILKNSPGPDQPDISLSFRPLTLPRAHSDSDQNYVAREFDFSSILTANKDPLSTKPNTAKVLGQFYTQSTSPEEDQLSQSQRPATADGTKNELDQNGRSIKKSVTFNSLVRLHHDNQASSARSFTVDV